jgi:hypothetical protein
VVSIYMFNKKKRVALSLNVVAVGLLAASAKQF